MVRACIAPPTDADKEAAVAAATRSKQQQQNNVAGGSTVDVGVRLSKLPTNQGAVPGQGLAPGGVSLGGRSVSSAGLLEGTDTRRRSHPLPSPINDDHNLSSLSVPRPRAGTGGLGMEGEARGQPIHTKTPLSLSSSSSSMFVPYSSLSTGRTHAATAMLLPRLIALPTSPVLVECIPPSPRGLDRNHYLPLDTSSLIVTTTTATATTLSRCP